LILLHSTVIWKETAPLDKRTGEIRWKTDRQGPIFEDPVRSRWPFDFPPQR
jgi:hypothetical protein